MRAFLTARWEDLVMANYVVDPELLTAYLPYGTELDLWQGRCYVSLVGFMFLDTRVLGVGIPFHRHFEEFNLRFYVRFQQEGEWRRGVVFVKEVVPRPAIALVANQLYNEHYIALPMAHLRKRRGAEERLVEYRFRFRKRWNHLRVLAGTEAEHLAPGSEAEFIAEHYWGCTRIDAGRTSLYKVEHPPWQVFPVRQCDLEIDAGGLYGPGFAELAEMEPSSVFLTKGSEVTVRERHWLTAETRQ